MQVVTSENFQQLVETGKVPEFVPPAAVVSADSATDTEKDPAKAEQPRGEDGKFVAKDAEVKADKVDEAAKAAVDDDEDEADLPERVRKQIGKKHRMMKEAEEFAREMRADREAERERADRAEAALKALQGDKPAARDSKEPRAEDYKTVGEYAEALAEYKVEKKFAEREAKREHEQREQAAMQAQEALNKRIAATVKEIPDYAEVVNDSDLDVPPHMAVYIAESPIGPKIGYHFAKNPDEFDRISKLSPIRAIAELGKLEDRLDKKPEPKPKEAEAAVATTSRAPTPIKPLEGNASVVQKDPAKMSVQELRAHETAQRAAKAARR